MCEEMNESLRLLFPKSSGVKIISEPGRYFVEGSMTLAASVIGKRTKQTDIIKSEGTSFSLQLIFH